MTTEATFKDLALMAHRILNEGNSVEKSTVTMMEHYRDDFVEYIPLALTVTEQQIVAGIEAAAAELTVIFEREITRSEKQDMFNLTSQICAALRQ